MVESPECKEVEAEVWSESGYAHNESIKTITCLPKALRFGF